MQLVIRHLAEKSSISIKKPLKTERFLICFLFELFLIACHDKQRFGFEALVIWSQAVGVVVFANIDDFLETGHDFD
ncbi:MAG: hypothetical protein GF353_15510, partial [Candidatus Lokiarchaeota archaeon]|nr:hypothetical protein [Candidatus Lokiarchaeota archaeon]